MQPEQPGCCGNLATPTNAADGLATLPPTDADDAPDNTDLNADDILLTDIGTPLPPAQPTSLLPPTQPIGTQSLIIPATSDEFLLDEAAAIEATLTLYGTFINPVQVAQTTVQGGQILVVEYEAIINNPGVGAVLFEVRDAAGAVLRRFLVTQTADDSFEVDIPTTGDYRILASTTALQGNFNVSYSTRTP